MNSLTRRYALPELNMLRHEFDRIFGDFQSERPNVGDNSSVWMPRADLGESEDSFTLALDLPGIAAEDVDVTFEDDTLTVSGHRESTLEQNDGRIHRLERNQGRFLRTIRFGVSVKAEDIAASFENGVLTVTIPKAESIKPRRIEVRPPNREELVSGDGAHADQSKLDIEVKETSA